MTHKAIDLLMAGLPVNLFKRRNELTKRMQRKHDLGGGLSVEVRRLEVTGSTSIDALGVILYYE